jgi:predicted GNAT family acetyltransferase
MAIVVEGLTAERFQAKAEAWLSRKEIQNNLFLGILSNLLGKPSWERQEHYFWSVESGGELLGTAFWTPPYKLTLSEMESEALGALARQLLGSFSSLPGVGGPKASAETFSRIWVQSSGQVSLLETPMRLYQLQRLNEFQLSPGALQIAEERHRELLIEWFGQFHEEIKLSEEVDNTELVENYITERRLWIWVDGPIRAMGAATGNTSRGARINMVYTPKEFRKKGYATSLVGALSRNLLKSGKQFCCLYTDLLNSTSNGIYQKIGYDPVCDWNVYRFK